MNSITTIRRLLSSGLLRILGVCLVAFITLLSAALSQEQPKSNSKHTKTVGLLNKLLNSQEPIEAAAESRLSSAQVSIAAFENDNDNKDDNEKQKPQIDPKLLSKSLHPIKITVELESGTNIPSWIRLLLPKVQLPKIQTAHGSVLIAIEQPDIKTLKRLSDEPAVVSIEVNRPPTF